MDGSALAGVDSMVSMRGEGMVSGQSNGVPGSDGGSVSESSSATAISGGTNGNNQVECHNGGATRNGESQWSLVSSDGSKMNKIQEIVENHTSMPSKCHVESLVQQVGQLSDVEKFLLYLKLPVGRSPDTDPLKQPLNPLGSRCEIQLTITWIKTHLEMNSEVSLPKREVYNEYMHYCNLNNIKALSTADFGKVMKQVFPGVRPRRLGQRGASKYCYSGLRKKWALDPPSLPDLND
ncbi:DNA-binding protein RFX7-like, partial [Penaeus vannamei]